MEYECLVEFGIYSFVKGLGLLRVTLFEAGQELHLDERVREAVVVCAVELLCPVNDALERFSAVEQEKRELQSSH